MEVVNILDDHSRLAAASPARRITRGPDVAAIFFHAFAQWGTPAAVLTDNGASSPPNNGRWPHRPGGHARRTRCTHTYGTWASRRRTGSESNSTGATASLGITRAAAHLFGAAWIEVAYRFTVYPG